MKPAPRPRKRRQPPKGRWAQVWLTPEFLAFAQLHEQDPEELASAVAHSLGLKNPARLVIHENVTAAEYQRLRHT